MRYYVYDKKLNLVGKSILIPSEMVKEYWLSLGLIISILPLC